MSLKIPFPSENLFYEQLAGTAGFTERAVVGAHHRFNICISYKFLEGGQIRIVQLPFCHNGIEYMTVFFGARMDGIMFSTRRGFEILGMVALQAAHECRSHLTCQEWILAPGFLPASPAGVAEDIDVW